MKEASRSLSAIVIITFIALAANSTAQESTGTQYKITINSSAHQQFGLYYPVTYAFRIPNGSSNLTAQYKPVEEADWIAFDNKVPSDFFNGVNAARFDYRNSTTYLSVAFPLDSDKIFLRVLNGQTEIPITFKGIPLYYDNRRAAVTVSLDDWNYHYNRYFNDACRILTDAHVHHTVAIITREDGLPPNWSMIQRWIDAGYTEPASHTRRHPCVDSTYRAEGYSWEIAGSRDDILSNLTLKAPYVSAFIEPCGFESPQVRQAVVNASYICDRGFRAPPIENTFAAWGDDGSYKRVSYSFDTWAWQKGGGNQDLLDQANNAFDSVYATGGIYHLMDHPWEGLWYDGSYLSRHIDHIKGRTDIWYAGFGELYLYRYVQERGQVIVSAVH